MDIKSFSLSSKQSEREHFSLDKIMNAIMRAYDEVDPMGSSIIGKNYKLFAQRLVVHVTMDDEPANTVQDTRQQLARIVRATKNRKTQYEVVSQESDGKDGKVIGYVDETSKKDASRMQTFFSRYLHQKIQVRLEYVYGDIAIAKPAFEAQGKIGSPDVVYDSPQMEVPQHTDYSPRIDLAWKNKDKGMLEHLKADLLDEVKYCPETEYLVIFRQLKKVLQYLEYFPDNGKTQVIYLQDNRHIDNVNNNISMTNEDKEMTTEEKIAIAKATMAGTHIDHLNQFFGDGQTLNFYPKDKERAKVVDITEYVKDENKSQEDEQTPPPPAKTLTKDERIKFAYNTVEREGLLKQKGDVAYIKKVMEEEPINLTFSNEGFLTYMRGLKITGLPDQSTIFRQLDKIGEKGEDGLYKFTDNCNRNEALRRNNLMKRFKSAYLKGFK